MAKTSSSFEYEIKVVDIDPLYDMSRQLNVCAEGGWVLISVVPVPGLTRHRAFFQRLKK